MVAAIAFSFFLCSSIDAGEIVDLRDGARTTFYGGHLNESPYHGDLYGWNITFGDVDGDGILDYLGSSLHGEGPNDENGTESDVYLFFGGSSVDSLYAVDEPGVADIVFYRGGFDMACGDVDADGYDDVIFSDSFFSGSVNIVLGGPRNQLRQIYNFNPQHPGYTPPDVRVTSARRLGGAIISLGGSYKVFLGVASGDINGDGYADILVGDVYYRGSSERPLAGAVHVILGRPRQDIPPVISVDAASALPQPDISIFGEERDAYPGDMIVGDFDGDGIDDLVTSTYKGDGEEHYIPGEIHCFWGKPSWEPTYDTQIETFDFALSGEAGFRLAAGDLDGDGRDDLIAAWQYSRLQDRWYMGEYRIYFGRPRAEWPKWGSAMDLTDVLIIGANTGDAFSVTGPNWWNTAISLSTGNRGSDPYEDLLIGAALGDRPYDEFTGSGSQAGKAYFLHGRPRSAWPAFIDLRDGGYDMLFYGADARGSPGHQRDLLGHATGMADWDGDGLDELFIAAQMADGPDNAYRDVGEVYVFFSEDSVTAKAPPTPPAAAALLPNYPNPFNPRTTFRFEAPVGARVSLTLYDVLGREVARPLEPEINDSRNRAVGWEARSTNGEPLPSGTYFLRLVAGNETHSRKLVIVR